MHEFYQPAHMKAKLMEWKGKKRKRGTRVDTYEG